MSALALLLLRFTGYQVCRNDEMCDPIIRLGPEGRSSKHSPARKGWVSMDDDVSAVGAALQSDAEVSP
jgi:hypothetical protein